VADRFLVALVEAGVEEAVVEVRGRVDGAVAGGKGSALLHQEPAVLVAAVGAFLRFGATFTTFGATGPATGDVSHLPGVGESDFVGSLLPIGQSEVVLGVAVGIAAEAADGSRVGVGEDDPGVAVPVEGDDDLEVSLDEAVDAADVDLELGAVLEGQIHQNVVDLEAHHGLHNATQGPCNPHRHHTRTLQPYRTPRKDLATHPNAMQGPCNPP